MFQNLIGLAWGVGAFALIIGISIIVLQSFGSAVAGCATLYTYNVSAELCQEDANASHQVAASIGTQNVNYLGTQLGTSGLAGWTPAIIALSVGLLFLGAFALTGKKGA